MIRPLAVAFILLAACGSDKPAAPTVTAASLPQCRAVVRVLDSGATCKDAPPDGGRGAGLRAMVAEETKSLSPKEAANQARFCALTLGELGDELAYRRCALDLTAEERGWIVAERTKRTSVPAGLTEAERTSVESVARWRDQVCACTDVACTRALASPSVTPRLAAAGGAVAKDAGNAMIEEAGVCHRLIEQGQALGLGKRP